MWTQFFAGLGFFLFGMLRLEEALKELAGRSFKRFLRRTTTNPLMGVINGTVATGILQSSGLVTLMVLAFVGAGILELKNALGIILGANLGTTFTGWIVALLGFQVDLLDMIMPLIAIGCCGIVFLGPRFRFYHVMALIASLGFLFLGLFYMKESMSTVAKEMDISFLKDRNLIVFFIFGFGLSAIIHSSSATMMMTLSALNAGVFGLVPAAALVIGADLGTTMTALTGSIRGTPAKRRVGAAHFFFNLIIDLLALLFIHPLLYFLQSIIGMQNPLTTLVAFHSSFNVLGIMIFFPFLPRFENFLNRLFVQDTNGMCQFISRVGVDVPEASIAAIHRELEALTLRIFDFNRETLGLSEAPQDETSLTQIFLKPEESLKKYEKIKDTEAEILNYLSDLQGQKLDPPESATLQRHILALRYAVQSAKSIKDIQHNLKDFQQSTSPQSEAFEIELMARYQSVFKEMTEIWIFHQPEIITEHLNLITQMNEGALEHTNHWIYSRTREDRSQDISVSTYLNVNKEVHSSIRYLLLAMRELHHAPSSVPSQK